MSVREIYKPKLLDRLSGFWNKKTLGFVMTAVFMLAIASTFALVQQRQDLRQRASYEIPQYLRVITLPLYPNFNLAPNSTGTVTISVLEAKDFPAYNLFPRLRFKLNGALKGLKPNSIFRVQVCRADGGSCEADPTPEIKTDGSGIAIFDNLYLSSYGNVTTNNLKYIKILEELPPGPVPQGSCNLEPCLSATWNEGGTGIIVPSTSTSLDCSEAHISWITIRHMDLHIGNGFVNGGSKGITTILKDSQSGKWVKLMYTFPNENSIEIQMHGRTNETFSTEDVPPSIDFIDGRDYILENWEGDWRFANPAGNLISTTKFPAKYCDGIQTPSLTPSAIYNSATTLPATDIGGTFATLNSTVEPSGGSVKYYYRYQPYTSRNMVSCQYLTYSTSPVTITSPSTPNPQVITDLTPEQPYYYCIVAERTDGTDISYGTPLQFTPTFSSTPTPTYVIISGTPTPPPTLMPSPTPTPALLPDLTFSGGISINPDYQTVNFPVNVKFTIINKGGTNSSAEYSYIYQSDGYATIAKDNTCVNATILYPGSSCISSNNFTFPTGGSKTLKVYLDPKNNILESNEYNNSSGINFNIIATTPTLAYTPTPFPTKVPTSTPTPYYLPSLTPYPTFAPTSTPFPTPKSIAYPTTFTGEYFNNKSFSGSPVLVRTDSSINFYWGDKSPSASISTNNFSARWTRTENFVGGNYLFTVSSDDGMRILVDGSIIYNDWTNHSAKTKTFTANISSGVHTITVLYYENSGKASAYASWARQ